ncbi:MAG: hypothetical protein AAB845_01050, partial [Patescibacteria group bacterium]
MNSFRRVIRKGVLPCLQKTFSFSVVLSLIMQPIAAPILLGAFAFSVPTRVVAQETEPVEEVTPAEEEEPAPAEEEIVPEETPAEEPAPTEEVVPVTPVETPAVVPTEEVATPASDDQKEEVKDEEQKVCLQDGDAISESSSDDWDWNESEGKAETKE